MLAEPFLNWVPLAKFWTYEINLSNLYKAYKAESFFFILSLQDFFLQWKHGLSIILTYCSHGNYTLKGQAYLPSRS